MLVPELLIDNTLEEIVLKLKPVLTGSVQEHGILK